MEVVRTPAEAAAYWAMRMNASPCSPNDRAAFEAWRAESEANAAAFARVERALGKVDLHVSHPDIIALAQGIAESTQRRRFGPYTVLALVASTLLCVVGIAALIRSPEWPGANIVRGSAPLTYETATGERSSLRLADGSTVTLNTRSRLEVDFTSLHRTLRLKSGQALFEVAHDVDRPFVVEAAGRRIVATGTAFDVRLDAAGVQVTMIEGHVSVDEIAGDGARAQREPKENLEAGQQLIAAFGQPVAVNPADVARTTSWREGRLVFRNDRLEDVLNEMNRYSDIQLIAADDPVLRDLRISGVFDTGGTASFLLALDTAHSVQARQLENNHILLLR